MANKRATSKSAIALTLPRTVRARGGAMFDPSADVWVYKDGPQVIRINLVSASAFCNADLLLGLKMTLLWYVENRSSGHVKNLSERMSHFLHYTSEVTSRKLSRICAQDVINYRTQLDASTEWYLRIIGILLLKWQSLGYGGIDSDAVKVVRQMRLKANARGVAVLTMDPLHGPYTDIELESIQVALDRAFADAKISVADFLLAYLFILLGARPVQLASLKLADFHVATTKDGATEYCLRVPRAKQRHGKARFEFRERLITRPIGEVLQAYVSEQQKQFAGLLPDPLQAPMFRGPHSKTDIPGFDYHCTPERLRTRLEECLNKLEAYSERTGALLHITATRFRRTLGTRAAAEGHGELVIAELLDHSDTSNVVCMSRLPPRLSNALIVPSRFSWHRWRRPSPVC